MSKKSYKKKNRATNTTVYLLTSICFIFAWQARAQSNQTVQTDASAQKIFSQENYQSCLLEKLASAADKVTLGEIREACETQVALQKMQMEQKELDTQNTDSSDTLVAKEQTLKLKLEEAEGSPVILASVSSRILRERETKLNPYVLTPHNLNYALPFLSTNQINKGAYESINGYEENLADVEAKFQLSLKVPLNTGDLLFDDDALYLGFTLQAWWQVHSENISKPFRETNYKPELFYLAPLKWNPFGGNTGAIVGIEHQSNGRGPELSRSWNRVYMQFLFEKDNFAFSLRPWMRLEEDPRRFELDTEGDDNPDIEDFMGNFELGMAYKWRNVELSFMGRQNFSTQLGAAELGLTFPLFGNVRGYATAFKGYGESLIDYNYSQTRFGIGLSFNNIL